MKAFFRTGCIKTQQALEKLEQKEYEVSDPVQALESPRTRGSEQRGNTEADASVAMCAELLIEGGNKLSGVINNQGAKNSAMHVIAGSLLANGEVTLKNVPSLYDVKNMVTLVEEIGADVSWHDRLLKIRPKAISSPVIPTDSAMKVRSSLLMLGIFLSKFGHIVLPLPGGCKIGARKFDMHLDGLKAMGAEIELNEEVIEAKAKRLHGAEISFYYPTVTGTMNLTLAAVLADGVTVIENAAINPEVVDFLRFMQELGARIDGIGTRRLRIKGVEKLKATVFEVMYDRIAAVTYMLAGAMTGGEIVVKGIEHRHLRSEIQKMREAGIDIECDPNEVRVHKAMPLRPLHLVTSAYPGFHTDVQPLFASLLCLAEGKSTIKETILDNRFGYVSELNKMGAKIRIKRGDFLCVNGKPGSIVSIEGGRSLHGADVWVTDLRAGAALVIAALVAKGQTCVHNIIQIDRGYENIEDKLSNVGASIGRHF